MSMKYYPVIAAITANIIAQLLKPVFYYFKTGNKDIRYIFESGGFPSSHTSMVVALTFALGFTSDFSSDAFFISAIFSLTVIFDAANVRYYAGQNIRITKALIEDLELLTQTQLSNPVYQEKLKEVLGHKWIEVFGGFVLGSLHASILYFMWR